METSEKMDKENKYSIEISFEFGDQIQTITSDVMEGNFLIKADSFNHNFGNNERVSLRMPVLDIDTGKSEQLVFGPDIVKRSMFRFIDRSKKNK